MATENHHHHHHHHHSHHFFYHQRTTFLPMLCSRTSIKDVSLPKWRNHSVSFSNDPLSPRIGCMGQVKRHNKISGFPISSHRFNLTTKNNTNNSSISPIVKYSKLKRLFSGKNLSTNATSTASSCESRKKMTLTVNCANVKRNQKDRCRRNENVVPISIENMDPPLPVIRRVQNEVDNSLWKRRSGGTALKSLQLQQIHHPTLQHLQVTSV